MTRAGAVIASRYGYKLPAPVDPPPIWEPVDRRGTLPTRPGATPYPKRSLAAVNRFRVHYTAGVTLTTVDNVAAYQTGPGSHEAFPEIAYHLCVDGWGVVSWCHDFNVRVWGSAQPGSNERDIHCVYTGLFEPNGEQMPGIKHALAWAEQEMGMTLELLGHKDGYATSCPGPTWPDWKDQLR